jgi:hypothetical protein
LTPRLSRRSWVDDPARLEHVRVGDLIEATFVEGVTIAVERTGVRGS